MARVSEAEVIRKRLRGASGAASSIRLLPGKSLIRCADEAGTETLPYGPTPSACREIVAGSTRCAFPTPSGSGKGDVEGDGGRRERGFVGVDAEGPRSARPRGGRGRRGSQGRLCSGDARPAVEVDEAADHGEISLLGAGAEAPSAPGLPALLQEGLDRHPSFLGQVGWGGWGSHQRGIIKRAVHPAAGARRRL